MPTRATILRLIITARQHYSRHSVFGHIRRLPDSTPAHPWSSSWIPDPETHHMMTGTVRLVDHGLHGWVRSCGTPDSLLLTHGLSPTTSQHGGRYDPQPVTRSTDWLTVSIACYAKRCTSYRKSVRLSVRLSATHGTVSKRLKLRSWGLHCRITPWI